MVEELPGNITELLLTFFLKNLKGLSLSFQWTTRVELLCHFQFLSYLRRDCLEKIEKVCFYLSQGWFSLVDVHFNSWLELFFFDAGIKGTVQDSFWLFFVGDSCQNVVFLEESNQFVEFKNFEKE